MHILAILFNYEIHFWTTCLHSRHIPTLTGYFLDKLSLPNKGKKNIRLLSLSTANAYPKTTTHTHLFKSIRDTTQVT